MNKSVVKKLFWMCFTLVLSVLTIWALLKQSESMSVEQLIQLIWGADKKWMIAAILAAFSYVIFEAIAICSILNSISHEKTFKRGLLYSTADVYFSAITPSATGGQPASAFFMIRDGIPGGVTSAALVLNLMMYNASIVFFKDVSASESTITIMYFSIPLPFVNDASHDSNTAFN